MRILVSTCYLTALVLGVTGFTSPSTTSRPFSVTSSSSDSIHHQDTRLAASYDYVSTPPSNRNSNRKNSSGRKINRRRRKINKDVVIVGGGLAGLSAALYLSQIDPNRQICILDKHELFMDGKTSVATFAAAGMLAPHSERLPKGDYLDLCLASKQMYPEFTDLVECMAQDAGEEGEPYLTTDDESSLEPWNIGYVASGGFLAPAFAGDTVATWAPPEDSNGNAMWLDATQVRELEPNLHPDVVGGWWFPEDASVDARRLAASLRAACVGAGVQLLSGKNYEVSSLDLEEGNCNGLWLKNGKYIQTNTCLVANGAWMRQLLPVPLEPHKGQSLSLKMPTDRPPILRRVLFASDSYIVPKADGRIIIGATVEAGSYDPNVTPAGLMHILSYALQLVPGLADLPIDETWAGLRPTTPDKAPILGKTPWNNLFLAGGYWRNGVLLAPKTGELLATLMAGEELSDEDEQFLEAFAWDRFTSKEGGAAMIANARYAASMYPVHSRKSGVGVAAAVGTELGSYSTAVSAGAERRKDRDALFGGDGAMDALEKAAAAGKADGLVFSFGGDGYKPPGSTSKKSAPASAPVAAKEDKEEDPTPAAAEPIIMKVNGGEGNDSTSRESELAAMREARQKNRLGQDGPAASINGAAKSEASAEAPITKESKKEEEAESEETFDGYQTILNAAANDDDIRETMRRNRMKNRLSHDENNTDNSSKASQMASGQPTPLDSSSSNQEQPAKEEPLADLSSVYQKIKDQKAAVNFEMNEAPADERLDPGFRIFHVDDEGTEREVPPYTSPGIFLANIGKENAPGWTPKQYERQRQDKPTNPPVANVPVAKSVPTPPAAEPQSAEYNESSLDGYQDIISANGSTSRDDELAAMREARRRNRLGHDGTSNWYE